MYAFQSCFYVHKGAALNLRVWKLNNFLLESQGLQEQITKDIERGFFAYNEGSAGGTIVWDTCKAYLRGN